MSRKPSPSQAAAALPKLDVQRIRVNSEGYDRSGAYWGAGQDVFIVTMPDRTEEATVRAANVTEARKLAVAELGLITTEPDADAAKPRIGGHPSRKSRIELDWRNAITGQTVRLRVTHARNYLTPGTDHIEIESLDPKRTPLPITETGYRSHFMPALDLINAGGPVTFVTAWINQEAKGKVWTKTVAAKAQGDLFGWAQAQGEVGKRKTSPKPKPPTAKAAKSRGPKRDPT